MKGRLFTFGCSFTRYCWPTWANILGEEFDSFENWGKAGAGNSFILYSLMECHQRNNLTTDDTVIVMWTSAGREDRWVNNAWIAPGSIYNQDTYDQNFVVKFADPTGYLIRDLAILTATRHVLDNIGCTYHFLQMAPWDLVDDSRHKKETVDSRLYKLYNKELERIKPSVYDTVFNGNWSSRNDLKPLVNDDHPIPGEHLIYLEQVLPQYEISKSTRTLINKADQDVVADIPFNSWDQWHEQDPVSRL